MSNPARIVIVTTEEPTELVEQAVARALATVAVAPAPVAPAGPALPDHLTTAEAASLLRCSPKTLDLDRVRRRWRVPYIKVGRKVLYERRQVEAWMAARHLTVVLHARESGHDGAGRARPPPRCSAPAQQEESREG